MNLKFLKRIFKKWGTGYKNLRGTDIEGMAVKAERWSKRYEDVIQMVEAAEIPEEFETALEKQEERKLGALHILEKLQESVSNALEEIKNIQTRLKDRKRETLDDLWWIEYTEK